MQLDWKIEPLDEAAMIVARARQAQLAKPPGSLGRLEELSIQLAGITEKVHNKIEKKHLLVFAADNGVVEEGVSSAPQSVTLMQTINLTRHKTGASTSVSTLVVKLPSAMWASMQISGKPCIYNIEEFTAHHPDPVTYFESHREQWRNSVLILQDIFCGVVPMGAENRAWRQRTGRLAQYLSREADRVSRIFCGLEQRLK